MLPIKRQEFILDTLNKNQSSNILQLAQILNVSHMTIRRDLQTLQMQGVIVINAGEVRLNKQLYIEPNSNFKKSIAHEQKRRIAKRALSLIKDGSTIFLDGGSTSFTLCHLIKNKKDLTVVSNDFEITHFLLNNSLCKIIHTGGEVNRKSNSTAGFLAYQTISYLNIDTAFMSANAWNKDSAFTSDGAKVLLKQTVLKSSNELVLIADTSKYNKKERYRAFSIKDLNYIITDKALEPEEAAKIREQGVILMLV